MKKLLTFALLSLGAFCLNPGKASAWLGDPYGHWWCREVCTWPYVPIKVPKYRDPSGRGQWFGGSRGQCCGGYPAPYFMKPYNAFSLPSFGSFGDPGCGYPPPCGGPYGGSGGQPMIILNMSCPPNYSPPNDGPYGRMGRQPGFCPPNYCPPVYGDTANCGPMSSGPICYETVCPPSCIPSCDPSSLYSPMGQGRVIVLNPNGGGLPTQLPAAGTMLAIPASMRSGGASVLQLPPVQPSGSTPLRSARPTRRRGRRTSVPCRAIRRHGPATCRGCWRWSAISRCTIRRRLTIRRAGRTAPCPPRIRWVTTAAGDSGSRASM